MTRDTSVFVKYDTIFRTFFLKLPQIQTSKFHKVVRQHTEGMVGSTIFTSMNSADNGAIFSLQTDRVKWSIFIHV